MSRSRVSMTARWAAVLLLAAASGARAETLELTLDPAQTLQRIDEKVYGHFLEHIYNSCNGGLWGELIWNRSFEQNNLGRWHVENGEVVQGGMGTDQRLTFGDPQWQDYELTLEARKTGGSEGFLILFRVKSDDEFYWVNLGGWGNEYHRIERGLGGGGRWSGVGPRVDGQIAADRWYRIRVRCEGPRFQIFLDDRPLIDFTDDQRAHLSGRVGVGTWATLARFRNVRVTALDGRELFSGMPENAARPSVASQWQPYGDGRVFIESGDALNAACSQRIESDGAEAGLRQGSLAIRSGETYTGSLWARGEASAGLVVRLRDGQRELAGQSLDAPGKEWRELHFSLAANGSSSQASIEVGLAGAGRVWIDQVSLMPASWRAAGGFRPDLLQAIAELQPPVIRWPGGCFASSYQWKQGIGPQHQRLPHPREIWGDLDVYSFGTDEFVAMCRRVGAEPLIVVNIGSVAWNTDAATHDYVQDILDWIEYCNGPADSPWGSRRAANGHPEPYGVKYWEIDNETWHLPAEEYARRVLEIAPRMRAADPSIRLAACGSGGLSREGRNGLPYNRTVIARAAQVLDYLSIHHYEAPDRFADGPGAYEAFFRETGELIAASANPQLKIYVSEWNAQSTDWRTGLYCGGLLNAFERCGDLVEIGGPALFLRHTSARDWDNAFINFDQSGWFPAPNYVVMRLWREHYAPQQVALDGDAGPLNAIATRSDDGLRLVFKAVNPSSQTVPVALRIAGDLPLESARMQIVAPGARDARNTLEDAHRVRPVEHPVERDGRLLRFEMPPLSAGVVTVGGR